MSFGFSIGDIIAVSQLANKVRKRFVDSPDQFKAVSDEVKSLSNVLRDIEDVLPERELTLRQQQDRQDHIQGCENVLKDLDKIIDKYQNLDTHVAGFGSKSRRLWKRLKFEPEDVRELRLRLISNIALWNSFTGTLSLGLSQSTKAGVDRLNRHQNEGHLHTVAEWLSASDYPAQQSDLIIRCQEGTGKWLFDSEEFQAWLDGTESTLFCPGIPGAGKTMITSIMINKLQQRFQGDKNVGIAYVYCNYKRQTEQTLHHLMASVLKQIVQQQPDLPQSVSSLYSRHMEKRTRPSIDEMSTMIRSIIHGLSRAFIVIDALDECTDTHKTRSLLLREIAKIRVQPNICFFATSRFVPDITAEFSGVATLEIRASDEDVQIYLEDHMSRMPACVSRNRALQEAIQAEIVKSSAGMFLLVQLHLEGLRDKITAKEVKAALKNLPKGSGALRIAYAEALERIKCQNPGFRRLAEAVLSWVVCAQRQLTISELQHALAVEDGATELAKDNLPEVDEMVSVCAGMVTVDEESGIIRLVHFTMQEYFESTLLTWAPLAQATIAKTCLTYLSFDVFSTGPYYSSEKLQIRCQSNVLFDYAASYWGFHVESTAEKEIKQMALGFLDNEKNVALSAQIVMGNRAQYDSSVFRINIKAMHLIAYLGLERLVLTLLGRGQYVDREDSYGRTPLSYAAANGHEAVVRILLDQAGVRADCEDAQGRTPLSYASSSGHVAVAKLLMNRDDVNINSTDRKSRTPLLWAAWTGKEGIVVLLLDKEDLQVCLTDKYQETPLMKAASRGHENIVRILLQKEGHEIYAKDHNGQMALHLAATRGKDKIVMLLLERNKDQLNAKDYDGRTALIVAARNGNLAAVKLLLERDGSFINEQDKNHNTVLMYAAYLGHETIVRLLLKREEVQINKRNCSNRTALEIAAHYGQESIVNLLLEREDVDLSMNAGTLEKCSQPIRTLIERAKDRKHGGPSWRDESFKVSSEMIDE